jgi:hypothetical protein
VTARGFFTALAVAGVGVVIGALGVTYAVNRKAARKHAEQRRGRWQG